MADLGSFPNVATPAPTDELVLEREDGTGVNVTWAGLLDAIEQAEGLGLTAAEKALLARLTTNPPMDRGIHLPTDAHPDTVFFLESQDGAHTPGIYERRTGGNAPSRTNHWTGTVVFADDGAGGLVWDESTRTGSATGLPDEVRSIREDAAGETMTLTADTDESFISRTRPYVEGPGDLTIEIEALDGTYSFNTVLDQQGSIRTDPTLRVYTFHGTDAPGLTAGRAYRVTMTSSSRNVNYWTERAETWVRINLGGHTGGGLTQNQVDDRIRALVGAVYLLASAARIAKDKLPSDTVYDGNTLLLPAPAPGDGGRVPTVNPAGRAYYLADAHEAAAGEDGSDGLTPIPAIVDDGDRRVVQIVDWYPLTGAELQHVEADSAHTNVPFDSSFSAWIDVAPAITARTSSAAKLNVALTSVAKLRRTTTQDGVVSVSIEAQAVITDTNGVSRTISLTPRSVNGRWTAAGATLDVTLAFTAHDLPVGAGETAQIQIRADRAGQTGRDLMDVRVGASEATPTIVLWTAPGTPQPFEYVGARGMVADAADGRNVRGPLPTNAALTALLLAQLALHVYKDARTGQSLTDGDKKAARDRIDAEKAGREDYVVQDLGGYNTPGGARQSRGADTGVTIPPRAIRLLVSPFDDGNYDEIDVARLLALPDVTSSTDLDDTNSLQLFEETEFRIAHRGRGIYFAVTSVQAPATAEFVVHLPRLNLPEPAGSADANKYVRVNAAGDGYVLASA